MGPLTPSQAQPPLLSAHPTVSVHLLQLMNIHEHIIIQGPYYTLGFTLVFVLSLGLDKCVIICIHYY